MAAAATETTPTAGQCPTGTRPGAAGASDDLSSPQGVRYNLRAPTNYRAERAHPLLVVYAPAGHSARASEALTRLTFAATSRGWLVAYAAASPLATSTLKAFAALPEAVAARWCVDRERVFATGHSDGGTVSTALAVLPDLPHPFAAIAPSAAGFTGQDLKAYACPALRPVRVLHNAGDTHFPGYGREAAQWWANCNACTDRLVAGPGDCAHFEACADQAGVEFCERAGSHLRWTATADEILDFFERVKPASGSYQAAQGRNP